MIYGAASTIRNIQNRSNGFTLIELLVTVSIIAILASIGFASYSSTSRRGRNTKRLHDLEQIRNAEEMFKSDSSPTRYSVNLAELQQRPDPSNPYMRDIPQDPRGSPPYLYNPIPVANPQRYCICTFLETPPTPPSSSCIYINALYNYCQSNP